MSRAFVALGSNLEQPAQQLERALAALRALPDARVEAGSSVYRSAAVGPGPQPDYLNAVVQLETTLAPLALLDALQAIEAQQGRRREQRWGPRTLDLDLLLYGELELAHPRLILPHPRLRERAFVLYPLSEIGGATLSLPDGTLVADLVDRCPVDAVVRVGALTQEA